MTQVQETTLTLAEFIASPLADEEPAWEYLPGGRLVHRMSPGPAHALIAAWLSHLFFSYAEASGAEVQPLVEVRTVLSRSSLVPDFAVVHGALKRDAHGEFERSLNRPMLVSVELLSPGESRASQIARCELFVREGTPLAFMVDPRRREIIAVSAEGQRTYRDSELLPLHVVPELADMRLTVDDVFARLG